MLEVLFPHFNNVSFFADNTDTSMTSVSGHNVQVPIQLPGSSQIVLVNDVLTCK